MTEPTFSHLDAKGNAHMVDVGDKAVTRRRAVARGSVTMAPATSSAITAGTLPKGDVLATARIAGNCSAPAPRWPSSFWIASRSTRSDFSGQPCFRSDSSTNFQPRAFGSERITVAWSLVRAMA